MACGPSIAAQLPRDQHVHPGTCLRAGAPAAVRRSDSPTCGSSTRMPTSISAHRFLTGTADKDIMSTNVGSPPEQAARTCRTARLPPKPAPDGASARPNARQRWGGGGWSTLTVGIPEPARAIRHRDGSSVGLLSRAPCSRHMYEGPRAGVRGIPRRPRTRTAAPRARRTAPTRCCRGGAIPTLHPPALRPGRPRAPAPRRHAHAACRTSGPPRRARRAPTIWIAAAIRPA